MKDYTTLHLMAGDSEDLKVYSACLQDAVVKIGDFGFIPKERRFAFVANRFIWEAAQNRKKGPFWRVRTGVHFDDVRSAKFQHLRPQARNAVIALLAIRFTAHTDGGGIIFLDLAGGAGIRLEVESINAYLSDLSPPWPTRSRPNHEA